MIWNGSTDNLQSFSIIYLVEDDIIFTRHSESLNTKINLLVHNNFHLQ